MKSGRTSTRKRLAVGLLFLLGLLTPVALVGCSGDDDVADEIEDVGDEIGDVVEEAGDEIEDATDK